MWLWRRISNSYGLVGVVAHAVMDSDSSRDASGCHDETLQIAGPAHGSPWLLLQL